VILVRSSLTVPEELLLDSVAQHRLAALTGSAALKLAEMLLF
jgi:hypothetical protein